MRFDFWRTPGLLMAAASLAFTGCTTEDSMNWSAEIWMSRDDESLLLEQQPAPRIVTAGHGGTAVTLKPDIVFQEIDGFGASMTESSAYALSTLAPQAREQIMRELFHPVDGIGISMLRQPMGSPDFALSTYSYNDLPPGDEDFELEHFSIEQDREYILPFVKRALEINPDIQLMASPWSPPAWMKTGGSMIGAEGGVLRQDCYPVYAEYFLKFLQAYREEGINIFAVTVQNEPDYAPASYAGLRWPRGEEARFIAGHLGPLLEREAPDTLIIAYDHNWDRPELAADTLGHPGAASYVAGSAWHYYGGSASAMSAIRERFPEKHIWFTEGSTGTWIGGGSFASTFNHGMSQAIDIMNNWSRSLIWWNIALDEHNGPIVFENTANYGLLRVDASGSQPQVSRRASYYSLAHFSKFVRPGARRIGLEIEGSALMGTAFRNPDSSLVAVLYNPHQVNWSSTIRWAGRETTLLLPGRTAATLVLREESP